MGSRLYLLRHGETEYNVLDLYQGRADSPLTELGKKQVLEIKDYIEKNGIVFDHVYSSPAGRAIETTELVTEMPYKIEQLLIERSFGSLEGTPMLHPRPGGNFPKEYGGESNDDLDARVVSIINEIMNRENHNSVLLSVHGGVARMFAQHYEKYSTKQIDKKTRTPNGSLFILEKDGDIFRCIDIIVPKSSVIEKVETEIKLSKNN